MGWGCIDVGCEVGVLYVWNMVGVILGFLVGGFGVILLFIVLYIW